MALLKEFKDEYMIFALLILAFGFIYINVDKDIGATYGILGIAILGIFVYFTTSSKYPFYSTKLLKNNNDWLITIIYTVAAYLLFSVISNYVLLNFAFTNQSVFEVLQASAPVLSNVKSIQFASFGQFIPFIETFLFFALLFDFLLIASNSKMPVDIKDWKTWLIVIIITISFVIFHLTAKLTTPNALYVTGIFAFISLALVVLRKQWIEALILHIMINSIVMFKILYSSGL